MLSIQVTAESSGIRREWLLRLLVLMLLLAPCSCAEAQHLTDSKDISDLPDAPQSQTVAKTTDPPPASTQNATTQKKCPPPSKSGQGIGGAAGGAEPQKNETVPCRQKFDIQYPFGKPPGHGQPLTSMDKLRIAASDVVDPFNLLTIGATAAISVGSNPDSHYGPGMKGWAKNSGTLLTEDMSGAFFVTYLVPSITRQDPRYYRMPGASIPRRIGNVLIQPVWARSDKGGHMPNFGMLIGVPAAVTLANVYVPGRKQGVWPTVETSAIAIATAPT
ncbi:MAG: hypothetical protein JOZ33_14900, partial [Acidobacteriaceae bacterium]|nr:hypothetical protein [Acidobacteriaceae bacterium]